MEIYHFETGNVYGKNVHHTVGDRRDWFYIPGKGIIVRRYMDDVARKYPNYWFSKDKNQMKLAEDILNGKGDGIALKLVDKIEIENNGKNILEEIIGHGQVYTAEQKNFVSKAGNFFDKYNVK